MAIDLNSFKNGFLNIFSKFLSLPTKQKLIYGAIILVALFLIYRFLFGSHKPKKNQIPEEQNK